MNGEPIVLYIVIRRQAILVVAVVLAAVEGVHVVAVFFFSFSNGLPLCLCFCFDFFSIMHMPLYFNSLIRALMY